MRDLFEHEKEAVAVCYSDIIRLSAILSWRLSLEGYDKLIDRVTRAAMDHSDADRAALLKMAEIVKLYRDDYANKGE